MNGNLLKSLLAMSIVLVLAACSDDSDVAKLQALEDSGAIPKLERSASVAGIDVNSDGIRDDVESYVIATYMGDARRAAARQFAKTVQAAMLVNTADLAAVKTTSVRGSRAVNCVYARFDGAADSKQPAQVVAELSAVSANTKPRLLAYLAYSKALNGTVGALPEGDTCE